MPRQIRHVPEAEIREIFNREIMPKIGGEYRLYEARSRPPQESVRDKFPTGTRSVNFEVYDQGGNFVAAAHAYVGPDGAYLASGHLDPKTVVLGNVLYQMQKSGYIAP